MLGVILNYASYMKKKDDVVLSGLTASATNELFEVGFGGLITLTAAFVFLGLSGTTAAVAGGTFGLGFNTLPVVFARFAHAMFADVLPGAVRQGLAGELRPLADGFPAGLGAAGFKGAAAKLDIVGRGAFDGAGDRA